MSSDRMMEYYYSMGQDCLTNGALDDAVTYFRKAANMGADEAAYEICAIGRQMETGDGVEKNEGKAESCYKIGVEYGIEGLAGVVCKAPAGLQLLGVQPLVEQEIDGGT